MTTTVITYTALRSLVDGVTSGDQIEMYVTLTAFNPSYEWSQTNNLTKSGIQDTRDFYGNKNWSVTMVEDGYGYYADGVTEFTLDGDHMDMFFNSVRASEEFTITDIDDSNNEKSVQLIAGSVPSIGRRAANFINKFTYTFSIREAI